MKRYILAIVCCVMAIMTYAACTTLTGSSVEISRWYDFYMPAENELECWTVELTGEGPFQIRYNIDLDQFQCNDEVRIYEIKNDGTLQIISSFFATTTSGAFVTYSKKFRVEYYGITGKLTEEYFDGFQLYFEKASHEYLALQDYYVLGRLGIGTIAPKEKLHVNGAIRGGGTYGEVTLKGDNGSVTIGATNTTTMAFNTDKNVFTFNKPIQGSGTRGALKIMSTIGGYLELCPMDSSYVRFNTNTSGYYFDKNVIFNSGQLISPTNLTFSTNTSTSCMTMLTNGNIGIGTSSPNYKLDVNGTIRANEIIVNTTGADFVFADDYQLRPLSALKVFITENKHLPEIKSAQEMQENGVGVNELQTQLLQKIEELTLYILQQEERIKVLEELLMH